MRETGDPFEGHPDAAPSVEQLAKDTRDKLQAQVSSMSLDNFVVRTQRKLVEKYQKAENWTVLNDEAAEELAVVGGLPNTLAPEKEEAKRFDLLVLSLQLALLHGEARFDRLKKQLVEIAAALEIRATVPAIAQHLIMIEEVQRDEWWEGITVSLLELVRRRLRLVVHLIDRTERTILYSDFEDYFGASEVVALPGTTGVDLDSFHRKTRDFLRHHADHLALAKLRMAKPLTEADLAALEDMLLESGIANHDDVERAANASHGLANFIRSLVGLDRAAAKALFAEFLDDGATADQIEFIEMIVDYLTENGVMEASALYESPFKELSPEGPDALFSEAEVIRLVNVLGQANLNTVEDAQAAL